MIFPPINKDNKTKHGLENLYPKFMFILWLENMESATVPKEVDLIWIAKYM